MDAAAESAGERGASGPGLARSAGLLALGSVGSRVVGLLREMVIATWFGAGGPVSAFRVAAQVPTLLYDLLVGGMLSAALVPVLSQTIQRSGETAQRSGDTAQRSGDTAQRDRSEFARLAGVLLGVFGTLLALLAVALWAAAPWLATLLAGGFRAENPELLALTTRLLRLMAPAVWFFSLAGLLTAFLYALQRFSFPALATALFNLGVVLCVPLLASRIGIAAAALGVLAGSLAQVGVLAWDVRRAGYSLRPRFEWRHPALRRIVRLYLPVAAGLAVMLFQVGLDRRLASGTGAQSIAWMANATTLQQMPLGLISVAIALAALPSLSRSFAAGDEGAFRRTLGQGLRFVLLLITPAAVALALLAEPVTRLLFERGAFTPQDTQAVAGALRIYLVGMLFAAVDFPLNYAYYARGNTLLPALVGMASVAVYVAVALTLVEPLGYRGLVWADTAKQAAHAVTMLLLLGRTLQRLQAGMVRGLWPLALAAGAMALALALVDALLARAGMAGVPADLLRVVVAGGAGGAVYVAVLRVLRVEEMAGVWQRLGIGAIIKRF